MSIYSKLTKLRQQKSLLTYTNARIIDILIKAKDNTIQITTNTINSIKRTLIIKLKSTQLNNIYWVSLSIILNVNARLSSLIAIAILLIEKTY